MARQRHPLLNEYVLSSTDYREFLVRGFEVIKEEKPHFSYAVFAQRAGFKSRGYIVDVIKGRKSLTLDSTQKVVRGLALPRKIADLFGQMVLQEREFLPARSEKIAKMQENLILDSLSTSEKSLSAECFYSDPKILIVYASLGDAKGGADFQQIMDRSQLSARQVQQALKAMVEKEMVEVRENRFYALSSRVVFDKLGESENFQNLYLNTLKLASASVVENIVDQEKLFYHAVVSLRKSQLTELRQRLRETITDFIHEYQDDNGDQVSTVQVSFF